jgi:hypothetical protein
LSTWDLLSPQPLKLFANETLYQLSYTPNLIDFSELRDNLRSKNNTCLYRYKRMEAKGIDSATKRSTSRPLRSIPHVSSLNVMKSTETTMA